MRLIIFALIFLAGLGGSANAYAGRDVLLSIVDTANTFGTVNPCPT